ncbi:SRPBCC family protein [Haloarchaeobius sp. DYHT-AS-18]|uniref:SRPBCC family protein n=1 Tax=Haloarchaeobius sp. DYHT-AS-18 TaxID=3446117 RepID=UPI003EC0D88F
MADVTVSRHLDVSRPTVASHLDPGRLVELEGTFDVASVTETDEGWRVEATAPGMTAAFDVRALDDGDGYEYEQVGDHGPFASMETRLELAAAPDGTEVTATSSVDLGLPLTAVTDRVAGWKRRGELRRALDQLADAVE